MQRRIATLLLLVCLAVPVSAQKRGVAPEHQGYRVWAVDRIIVVKGVRQPAHAAGMKSFVCSYHKDGQHALCEFVADTPAAHAALFAEVAAATDAKMFAMRKESTKHEDFETAARAAGYTDVDLKRFSVR